MKLIKKWFLPVLTCLIIAGAAVLPPYISRLRDARQLGQVHAEPLEADALPVQEPPTLLDRLALYAGQYVPDHPILSFRDNTYFGLAEAEAQAVAAQELLVRAEVLPNWVFLENPFDDVAAARILLWSPEGESVQEPSVYWNVEWTCYSNKLHQMSVSLIIDAETGLPIHLYIGDTNMSRWLPYETDALRAVSERFFDLMGLEVWEVEAGDPMYVPSLNLCYAAAGSPVYFRVSRSPTSLIIQPDPYLHWDESSSITFPADG